MENAAFEAGKCDFCVEIGLLKRKYGFSMWKLHFLKPERGFSMRKLRFACFTKKKEGASFDAPSF